MNRHEMTQKRIALTMTRKDAATLYDALCLFAEIGSSESGRADDSLLSDDNMRVVAALRARLDGLLRKEGQPT